jgi:hypothetical protein
MSNLAISLVVIWSCGLIFLAGRALNFIRLIYNNLAPGKDHWKSRYSNRSILLSLRYRTDASAIDPESLTEAGRQYRKGAIRNERIMLAWGICGIMLFAWASSRSWMS